MSAQAAGAEAGKGAKADRDVEADKGAKPDGHAEADKGAEGDKGAKADKGERKAGPGSILELLCGSEVSSSGISERPSGSGVSSKGAKADKGTAADKSVEAIRIPIWTSQEHKIPKNYVCVY